MYIQSLHSFDDMQDAVELQKIYWGRDGESLVAANVLFTISTTGGHVLVAKEDNRAIGVLIGLFGIENRELFIASKRMVVLPEYRSQGIGRALKLKQREMTLEQGLDLVVWTFDPLLSTNAHFNIRKLGAISRTYLRDYYGTNPENSLVTLGSSDRLKVEWWVQELNSENMMSLDDYRNMQSVLVNPASYDGQFMSPSDTINYEQSPIVLMQIPPNYPNILNEDQGLAIAWREQTREIFQHYLNRGYTVSDFVYEPSEDCSVYVLRNDE